ncbi:DUF448 domain-containing protein [Sandaracinobacteroides saxicola]|uniref:DUF448 domain-containing protein n=1 Tax=Sandaracinobacteroides saxicola TaxID=2759707 RepID=A0A7G5IF49_9SPHN|nr:DUF448 domain-containing protein [Sandaracinobacteroides saxicola]QMW21991.1 DUF448 domain-containing protein [Sandaracinobacteroides saxicola]
MVPDETLLSPEEGDASEAGPTRTCVLTRATGDRAAFIRLVRGPDGAAWPDLAAKLPGRGAWIVPDRSLLAAVAPRKLSGLLTRALRAPTSVPDDLVERIDAGLRARLLQRLGLEHRAGHLMFGSDRLGEGVRRGQLFALFHAADAAEDGAGKLAQAARVGEAIAPVRLPIDRLALSRALGRDNTVHLGVTNSSAAARIMADVARLAAWCGEIMDNEGAAAPLKAEDEA